MMIYRHKIKGLNLGEDILNSLGYECVTGTSEISPLKKRDNAIQKEIKNMENLKEDFKILKLYKEKKLKKLKKDFQEKTDGIKEKDVIQTVIKEMQNQVFTILENDNQEIHYDLGTFNLYVRDTKEKLNKLEEEFKIKKQQLEEIIENIEALFEMTEDFSERMKILKEFKIIDKNGKIII